MRRCGGYAALRGAIRYRVSLLSAVPPVEFAETSLVDEVHKACVEEYLGDDVVWHVSRDSTEIEAREKPVVKPKKEPQRPRKRGRPRKGEERPKPEPTRLERQRTQSIAEAVLEPDRGERYKNRTTVERFNSRLKDDCGGRMVRVRGKPKVHAHLMFGVLVVFAQAVLALSH